MRAGNPNLSGARNAVAFRRRQPTNSKREVFEMESTYLKERLAKLATLRADADAIGSEINRKQHEARLKGCISENAYPAMLGELMGRCWSAQYEAEAALRSAERLEAIEREHERLIAIFEALEIDLDEESLATLELIGKREYTAHRPEIENSPYRDQRRDISKAFAKAIRETQENERDFEHDQATDAILAAGFVHDEENDCFARGDERVTVTLVNGRECRYEWTFEHFWARHTKKYTMPAVDTTSGSWTTCA